MQALSKLYTANLNNEVVVFGTNLKTFLESFQKTEPTAIMRNYAWYVREFKKTSMIILTVGERIYILQEVFNKE